MMEQIKKYISQILQDTNGAYSSKRAVTFICVFLMTLGFITNLYTVYTVDQFMFEAIMYIVIAGLGFSGAEKFAPKRNESVE
jgi:hypothetical protein